MDVGGGVSAVVVVLGLLLLVGVQVVVPLRAVVVLVAGEPDAPLLVRLPVAALPQRHFPPDPETALIRE